MFVFYGEAFCNHSRIVSSGLTNIFVTSGREEMEGYGRGGGGHRDGEGLEKEDGW